MEYADALRLQEEIVAGRATGVVDLSTQSSITNGLVFLRYYDGAWVNGTVLAGGATPVPGVTVTATDELGTPHQVTTTDADGRYSLLVPFGNVTITASLGTRNARTLQGSRTLTSVSIPVSLAQAMREDFDGDLDGRPDWILTRNLEVPGVPIRGTVYYDLDRDGTFGAGDRLAPGTTVTLTSKETPLSLTVVAGADSGVQFPALLQGGYRVRMVLDGHTVDAADLDLSSSALPDRDLPVPFAKVQGYANLAAGGVASGATVAVRDLTNGNEWAATTAADGVFSLVPLLAGEYELSADRGDAAAFPVRLRVTGNEHWQNFTLSVSGRVTGLTRIYGTPAPYATLEFQSASGVQLVRSVRSDASGAFAVTLPAGDWNVAGRLYSDGRLYATLGRLAVFAGGTATYTATFVDGARIAGTIEDPAAPDREARAQITFIGEDGDWWTRTGSDGAYLAYLPAGTYGFQAYSSLGVVRETIVLAASRSLDLTLSTAAFVSGTVYRDADGDGISDAGEGIPGSRLELRDDLGRRALAVGNASGGFAFYADVNRTYSGFVTARGFGPRSVASSTPAGLRTLFPMALPALSVPVMGTLLLDGSPLLDRLIRVRAVAVLGGAVGSDGTTDLTGTYYLELVPGTYDLVVDENATGSGDRRYQNLAPDRRVVQPEETRVTRDIAVVERILITGNTTLDGAPQTAEVSFDGVEGRSAVSGPTGEFSIYLRPGIYSVTATARVEGGIFKAFEGADFASSAFLPVVLQATTALAGQLLHEGRIVPVLLPISFVRAEGGSVVVESDAAGRYDAVLVPGVYEIAIDAIAEQAEGTVTRVYRYTFTGGVEIPEEVPFETMNLDLSRELHNTTVAGTVSVAGRGLPATLSFFAREGGALDATATSSTSGSYSVGLAPGVYDVHVTASDDLAYLRRITIPRGTTFPLDGPLTAGHVLSGVTTDAQGIRVRATVEIGSAPRLSFDTGEGGSYGALLPTGTYTVVGSREGSERGVAVEYRASQGVDLSSNRVVNLRLEKLVSRGVELVWDPSQRQTIPAGGGVTYEVEIENTGNVADTFALTGRVSGAGVWSIAFAPAAVPLEFGESGSRTTVSVTISSPRDALVEHGPILLFATSGTDTSVQGRVAVDVDIQRTRALEIRVNRTTGTFDGRFANFTVEVRSRGNAAENVTVAVTNPDDAAGAGWIPRLGREGSPGTSLEIVGLLVPANQTARVRLQLAVAGGASGAVIVLSARTRDLPELQATISYGIELPALSAPGGIGVGGPNIVRTPSLNATLVAVSVAAIAAAALAFVLTRRRR